MNNTYQINFLCLLLLSINRTQENTFPLVNIWIYLESFYEVCDIRSKLNFSLKSLKNIFIIGICLDAKL